MPWMATTRPLAVASRTPSRAPPIGPRSEAEPIIPSKVAVAPRSRAGRQHDWPRRLLCHDRGRAVNTIQTNATHSTIAGGVWNTNTGPYAMIPGGRQNSAAKYAFAAGRRAKADHEGAFVWADSTDANFASTSSNQFLVARVATSVSAPTIPNRPPCRRHGDSRRLLWFRGRAHQHRLVRFATGRGDQHPNRRHPGRHLQCATGLIIESRTSDPPSPAVGRIWLRTTSNPTRKETYARSQLSNQNRRQKSKL